MTDGTVLSVINMAMMEILTLSLPLLGTAMVVGLIISIFQATTSIQEQTLTFVPKILAIAILMVFIAPFYINSMIDFTENLFQLIAEARM